MHKQQNNGYSNVERGLATAKSDGGDRAEQLSGTAWRTRVAGVAITT